MNIELSEKQFKDLMEVVFLGRLRSTIIIHFGNNFR
jgi:hypothetical protein